MKQPTRSKHDRDVPRFSGPTAGASSAPAVPSSPFRSTARDRRRRRVGRAFAAASGASTALGVIALLVLLGDVTADGLALIDWEFLTSYASRFPERAGIKAALVGTVWVISLTAIIAFPIAVGAAVYLEEYAPRNWVTRAIRVNVANLAGVPSIVYGILGLALFVQMLSLGRSVISGALTLALLVLPIIVMAAQEAIRAVPDSLRTAAYALGATRWQVVRHQVLPAAMPGILTGAILALSRAMGETAPLIMIGALTFVAFTPDGLGESFTVLPIQIYYWVSRPQEEFRSLAAAAIIVLLVLLLSMNAVAIVLRNRSRRGV
jgi:phosphate transport system permease protein